MKIFGSREKKLKLYLTLFASVLFLFTAQTYAQTVVDKTVATVSDGVRTELITYSDLLWQLALRPGVSLTPPTSEDLNIALQLIINQRLFALEAERLPQPDPTPEQIDAEIKRVLSLFPSTAEFENRLRIVGFESVKDENFQTLMEQRVAIEKYIDFRFRSFAIITSEEEERYYREKFVPDFRRRNPGRLMPTLDETRVQINKLLREEKVTNDISKFLDDAKRRAEIVILNEV
jgi:hypothetical protein